MSAPACPGCGNGVMPGWRWCAICGQKLGTVPIAGAYRTAHRMTQRAAIDPEAVIGYLAMAAGLVLIFAVPLNVLALSFLFPGLGGFDLSMYVAALFSSGYYLPPVCGWAVLGILGWLEFGIGRDARAGRLESGVGLLVGGVLAILGAFFFWGWWFAILAGILLIVAAVLALVTLYA